MRTGFFISRRTCVMTYSEKALEALKKGDMNQFNDDIKNAKENDSDDMLYSLAEELYSLGFLNDSLDIYKGLLKKYPDEDELRTSIADILISEGKIDKALNYLSEIKPDSPNYVNALMVEADLYQTQEMYSVSEHKLLEAEKIDPDENVIKFALAELYFSTGQFDKAIPIYLGLIKQGELNISSVNLVERLGVAYANAGHFEQAIGYLEQIKPIDMTPDVKFETGFTYLQLKDYAKAIEMLKQLREDDPQYASLYPYLGEAYIEMNEPENALKVYQEGMSVDQYNVNMYIRAADVAAKLSEEDLALKYLKEGHKVDPDNMELIIKLSNLYVKQGEYQKNVDFLAQYVKSEETDPQIYWNLAVSYAHLEKYDEAQKYYQRALPYFDDNPDFLHEAILLFRENGQIKETIKLLKRYVKLVPTDDEMAYMLEDLEDYE